MEEIRESKKQAIDNKYRVAEPSLLGELTTRHSFLWGISNDAC